MYLVCASDEHRTRAKTWAKLSGTLPTHSPHILHIVLAGTPAEAITLDDVHPVLHYLGITETEFTVWEVVNAKKQISQGKAPGEPEILKRCDIDDRGISLLIDSRQPNKQSAIKSYTPKNRSMSVI